MTNTENQKNKKVYNLEERTAKFGENTIMFCKKLPKDVITTSLVSQLV